MPRTVEKRVVLVHYHLFKNAGTTIDGILSRRFPGEGHGHLEGTYPWSSVSPSALLAYVKAHPEIGAVSSHQAYLPLPDDQQVGFLPIVFLRHPIDRFGSVYEFERRQSPDSLSPSVAIARAGSLSDFAEWVVSREATAVCRNFQVARLAGVQEDMRYARATLDDYNRAFEHLRSLPFFGLVDSFQESLIRLQQYLTPYVGDFDISHEHENASPGRATTLEKRVMRIADELGPSLYRELLELNSLDMLLYREAQRRFADMRDIPPPQRPAPKALGRTVMRSLATLAFGGSSR